MPDLVQRRQLRVRLGQQLGGGFARRRALQAGTDRSRDLPVVREEPRSARRVPAQGHVRRGGGALPLATRAGFRHVRSAARDRRFPRCARLALGSAWRRAVERPRRLAEMPSASHPPAQPPTATPAKVSWPEWREHFLSLLRPYAVPLVVAHLAMLLDAGLT